LQGKEHGDWSDQDWSQSSLARSPRIPKEIITVVKIAPNLVAVSPSAVPIIPCVWKIKYGESDDRQRGEY
jgi:hypothetical protein